VAPNRQPVALLQWLFSDWVEYNKIKEENMKYLIWFALIVAIVVIINEATYVGSTSLAWVVIGLSAAIGALAIHILVEKK